MRGLARQRATHQKKGIGRGTIGWWSIGLMLEPTGPDRSIGSSVIGGSSTGSDFSRSTRRQRRFARSGFRRRPTRQPGDDLPCSCYIGDGPRRPRSRL